MVAAAEFPFVLPGGYSDDEGVVHREGSMRLATAYDEIAPLNDARVRNNPGYLVIILLSRVVVSLGSLRHINTRVMEGLLSQDFIYLQDLYRRLNEQGHARLPVSCPHCHESFEVEVQPPGEA